MQPKIVTITDDDFDLDQENFDRLDKSIDENRVYLDPYNADLNVKISSENRSIGESLSQDGFAFMLASVRATHGFSRGRIGFEVKILEIFDVSNAKLEETHTPEIRIGWSTCEASLRLGESAYGFGYCHNAKKVTSGQFLKFGRDYGLNDVVGALLDFDRMQISFTLNGHPVSANSGGTPVNVNAASTSNENNNMPAFSLPDEWTCVAYGPPLFPHITVKNVKFQVNFGDPDIKWFGLPDDYTFLNDTPVEHRIKGVTPPAAKEECTVLCMIGLPGSGKTTWVREFLRNSTDEKWTVLSTNAVLEQMKVQGVSRKKLHHGRWDMIMGSVVKCLNRLILLGCRMRRNYILDLTNCYPLPRRKKMTPFQGYRRKAVVLVPTIEDYANRCHQQMMLEGKQMPSDAILEMKACFTLPKEPDESDVFDEIEFAELQRDEAQKVVEYFNEEGKAFKPREKKRRGDWQQEELPAEMLQKYKTPKPVNLPVLKPASLKAATANNVKWVPKASRKNASKNRANGTAVSPVPKSGTSTPHRNSISSPGPFTPRAGWPASWPQALWSSNVPSTSSHVVHLTPTAANSPIVFPPP